MRCVCSQDPEDEEEDARLEVLVPLAKLEQPELAKLTMLVRGQGGTSTPAVSCNEAFIIELHGIDMDGCACRVDLDEFDASTKLMLSDLPSLDAVTATQRPWSQMGDGLEMIMELGGRAGELDIEIDPSSDYYSICDTLRLNLIAGEPDNVVASVASGDSVENGKELTIKAQLIDSYCNKVEISQGVEWNVQPVVEGVAESSSQGSDWGDGAAGSEVLRLYDPKQRKPKGAAAELRMEVLTVRPLHARDSFDVQVSARVKRGGVFHTFETETPLRVTISPGCHVIAGVEALLLQVVSGPHSHRHHEHHKIP